MAYLGTYVQIGQAEDVQDAVYDVSPVDAPIASMAQTIRATGKIHEWHSDTLAAAAANRAVEGADAGADSSTAMTNHSNYCQIFTKVAEVTRTMRSVRTYGRNDEMAYQLEKRMKEIVNDEELAIAGAPGGTRQTGAAGNASTARQLESIHSQLDSSVVVDADTYLTTDQLEDGVVQAHVACYNEGGNPSYLFTNPTNSLYIAEFARAAGRTRDIMDSTKIVNAIDLYVSQVGELDVVLDRHIDDCFLGIDFEYLATPVLDATQSYPLAKLGDSDRRQVVRESTVAVLNPYAHFMVDNIPVGLDAPGSS